MGELFTGTSFEEYEKYLLDYVLENNPRINDLYTKFDRKKIDIEAVLNEDSLSKREFVELIASRRRIGYDPTVGGGNKAAEDETDRLYAKNPWKFVEEFLQNADDCEYEGIPQVEIIVDEQESTVEFIYNEKGFSKKDIWAIAAFSQSTKNNDIVEYQSNEGVFYREKTGKKGKGFKSVFSLKAENIIVQIRSNGYCFKLDNKIGRVLPVWEEDADRMDGKTHVIVKLVNPTFDLTEIYPEFKTLFCVDNCEDIFAKSPFIFMHRIKSVYIKRISKNTTDEFEVKYVENTDKTFYKNEIVVNPNKVILAGIAKNGQYYEEQFQEGCIKIMLNSENKPDIHVVRYTRMLEDELAYRNYSIMAPVLKGNDDFVFESGSLFRTFPMSLHGFNMPMAIDAPFELNPDRSGIQYRDEKTDTINASEWNSIVSENVFKSGGVYESFMLWIRGISGIRIDKYIRTQNIVLFEDRSNLDSRGRDWVAKVNISALSKNMPIFRLFADEKEYVCFNEAEIVNKDLFLWPCVDVLFSEFFCDDYDKHIISNLYVGSQLFHATTIDKEDFTDRLNRYLDRVESVIGVDSQEMFAFVNKLLYPFLVSNKLSIVKADADAFKKMRIYFSRLQIGNDIVVVRENCNIKTKWIRDSKRHTSINRYRVIETSPVDMSVISEIIRDYLKVIDIELDFSPKNINISAKKCKDWQEAYELLEAACHFGADISMISFACLNSYVFSENYDDEYNAFRMAGVKEIIPDEDIVSLSRYAHSEVEMAEKIKKMGVKSAREFFYTVNNYLQFRKDTLELLSSDIDLVHVLKDIKSIQKESKKKVNATYREIKQCKKSVLAYLLNDKNDLFSSESYVTICDELQEETEYWKQEDDITTEILIRACAGSLKPINTKRVIEIEVDKALAHHLEYAIAKIVTKNRVRELRVLPSNNFTEIPVEEIETLLGILKPENQQEKVKYYKGNIGVYGSKKQYLKDGKGGHVYLNCDENGNYKTALEECVEKSFDVETLKVIDEMESQYQFVKKDILRILNQTGGDLNKTYDEIERRFSENYDKQQIISILSWFRYSGYTNALGNGNINNQKEIEDDYRNNPWKFVYEFIQNVDDCHFLDETPNLDIKIDKESNAIIFEYNETGFSLEDVKALTKFGDSRKSDSLDSMKQTDGIFDREKTGHKGRGFKSVFSLPGQSIVVHVYSNGFSFKFVKRLGIIIPIWEDIKDMPVVGTRIIVEGFDSKYLPKLINNIEKMFGISDMSSFYSTCPILYLRKLNKVSVNNCGKEFSIKIKTEISDCNFSEENFESGKNEIVAGIIKNGKLKKSLWERVCVSVTNAQEVSNFEAVRYTGMFSANGKTRIATVFAPFINKDFKIEFKQGALYRTLPLDDNVFDLPLSINAPFETNSGRSAVNDNKSENDLVIEYVFNELLNDFFMHLREVESVIISKYIPTQSLSVFSGYKEIDEIDLLDLIKKIPILKSYVGEEFVSCINAEVLFSECYEWVSPEILAECFSNGKKILVKREYVALASKCIRTIDFRNNYFVQNLNRYLGRIPLDSERLISFLIKSVYPYIDKHYAKIADQYKLAEKKQELRSMSIFVFEMADGGYVRESLQEDSIWLTNVPEGYDSYGKYRNIANSSISEIYENSQWIKDLHPKVIPFDVAFNSEKFKSSDVKDWDKAAELIKTILYYEIEKKPAIPYLENCVLAEEYDTEENFFRTGFLATGNEDIIKHIIDKNDLIDIAEITGKTSVEDIMKLASVIKSMGLKKADDFFHNFGKGRYELKDSILALLVSYCVDRESCSEVIGAIDKAFRAKKADSVGSQLHIIYEDIEQCNYLVLAKILEYEVVAGEVKQALAQEFCKLEVSDSSMDYTEAFFRALAVIGISPVEKEFRIALTDIIDRTLGECIQICKLKNLETISLYIDATDKIVDYPSEAIDKALQWLEDEFQISATYLYYTGNIQEAFTQKEEGVFLFDDDKVILNVDNDENSMIEFVQKRYKGNDASFRSLVQIVTQQNNLKGMWKGTKEEYIVSLSKFRDITWKLRDKLLFPDAVEYINNANGQSEQYVIPELLQNINDCRAAEGQTTRTLDVNINVTSGTMVLKYDEAGFDYENVYSITAIGQSSKHDKSEGEKGLGFKKVFTLFSEVEIYSNGFCFKLTAAKETVPKWISSKGKQEKYLTAGKTVMVFTIKQESKDKLANLLREWKSIMKGEYVGSEVSPIFLHNIDFINVTGCEETYSRSKMEDEYLFKSVQILPLYKKMLLEVNNEDVEEQIEYFLEKLKQRRKCKAMSGEDEIEDYLHSLTFELALPKKVGTKHHGKGCFYSTLPTRINIDLPMFMNIPLELTTGRDGKVETSDYNAAIMELIFKPLGEENKSIFTKLLEEVAKENPEIFMTDYFVGDFNKMLCEISNHDEKAAEIIKKSLDWAELFLGYNSSDMVSLSSSYTVDKIVCQYLMDVGESQNDILRWLKEHSEDANNYDFILPKKVKDWVALMEFAENIGTCKGYFPLKKLEDLSLLYLMEEYGYIGDEDDE